MAGGTEEASATPRSSLHPALPLRLVPVPLEAVPVLAHSVSPCTRRSGRPHPVSLRDARPLQPASRLGARPEAGAAAGAGPRGARGQLRGVLESEASLREGHRLAGRADAHQGDSCAPERLGRLRKPTERQTGPPRPDVAPRFSTQPLTTGPATGL